MHRILRNYGFAGVSLQRPFLILLRVAYLEHHLVVSCTFSNPYYDQAQ